MKKALMTLMMLAAMALMFGQAADLFFSEYVEGTSNNKALEIFNGTGDPIDLSAYTVKLGSNGGTWSATNILTMTGILDDGDVYIIANAGADPSILAIANVTSTVTYFNGDDAVALFHGDTMIDIIGVYQQDPGTAWPVAGVDAATVEHTLVRKPTVIQGNIDFVDGAGTNIDDSEWIVHPQNYFTNLGMHTFNPGSEQAASPTFNPPAGVYDNDINVAISTTTAGATIRYTLDGSEPSATSTLYSNPIPISETTTIKAKAFASGMDPSYTATAAYVFPVMVPNIGALRSSAADGSTVYHLSGQVLLAYQQSFRHQKYIQDGSGAILIDDQPGIITTTYNVGDGITGITGTLSRYSTGMLQFWPTMNSPAASSHNNSINAPVVTIAQINSNLENYQSHLVRLNSVHFTSPTGNYATGQSYDLLDATGTIIFRTQFYDADYASGDTPMHNGTFNVLGIVTEYNSAAQFTPRFLADFNPTGIEDEYVSGSGMNLLGNYPNPFNPETTIRFTADKSEAASLTIYNQRGQAVKNYMIPVTLKGINNISWDGRDNNGSSVSSGVYYFRLKSGSYSSTKKMVLMK
ncbi:MAG: chitobiase/beta-hexosaminidase C-terminal domain-containing protein [Candidatus Cloacimonetes bacterium]|nr:chitobiase/beta-hexosaminidase C-terminal domain-containing protein [Candidatus Cloacimonadota bacterium]